MDKNLSDDAHDILETVYKVSDNILVNFTSSVENLIT